jgi:hypothetical protein
VLTAWAALAIAPRALKNAEVVVSNMAGIS